MQSRAKRKKEHNRGFSLIELVIVITIMVVLTALLAPQLLRYVEKAREAKDAYTMDEVVKAVNLALASGNISIGQSFIWYKPNGTLCYVGTTLGPEVQKILGGTYVSSASEIRGLTPLVSKLYAVKNTAANPGGNAHNHSSFTEGQGIFVYGGTNKTDITKQGVGYVHPTIP